MSRYYWIVVNKFLQYSTRVNWVPVHMLEYPGKLLGRCFVYVRKVMTVGDDNKKIRLFET